MATASCCSTGPDPLDIFLVHPVHPDLVGAGDPCPEVSLARQSAMGSSALSPLTIVSPFASLFHPGWSAAGHSKDHRWADDGSASNIERSPTASPIPYLDAAHRELQPRTTSPPPVRGWPRSIIIGETIGTRSVGGNHDSFTSFLLVAGTLMGEPAGLHVATHGVCRPIRGLGHGLLLAAATTSPLRMPTVGTRSDRRGRPAAAMGHGLHGR